MATMRGNLGPERLHIVEKRLLLEIVADHVGHKRIDPLVIGDAGTDAIGKRHRSGAIGIHKPRHAHRAVGPERERV